MTAVHDPCDLRWLPLSLRKLPLSDDDKLCTKEIIMILLKNGADINMKNFLSLGKTSLYFACESGFSYVVKLLLDDGADPHIHDASGRSPLMIASESGKFDVMEALLINGVDVNDKDRYGNSPIHKVLFYRMNCLVAHQCIKLLLKYGADVNVQNKMGLNPLSYIVINYKETNEDIALSVIRLLLDAHTDLNIQFEKSPNGTWNEFIVTGDTVLHLAVRAGRTSILKAMWAARTMKLVKVLLEYHPDLSIYNQNNDTVHDISKKQKSYDIMKLIEEEHRKQIYNYIICKWIRIVKIIPKKSPTTI